MRKCISTNANKESRGFSSLFFMIFTSAVCADLVTEFHTNSTVDVGSRDGISFSPRSKVWVSARRFSQSTVISVYYVYGTVHHLYSRVKRKPT